MESGIHLNYYAIFFALVAKAILGHLWYGPFFGRAWNKELGNPPDARPAAPVLRMATAIRWVGMALTVYVTALAVEVIRPSSWGAAADSPDVVYGFLAPLFIWVGFYIPQLLSGVAWEGASWKLFRLHALYHGLALLLVGQILAHWR